MFLDDQRYTHSGKTYRRVLLRNSYRVEGKVHHTAIANLSQCSDEEIDAIKLALKHKGDLKKIIDDQEMVKTRQGLSVGAVWVLNQLAKQLGISKAKKYLAEHPRAKVEVARKRCLAKSQTLKIDRWTTVKAEGRTVDVEVNLDKRDNESRLDGCYVIKTDLTADTAMQKEINVYIVKGNKKLDDSIESKAKVRIIVQMAG